MDDNKIIDLYWKRSESAIAETDKKYGRYCNTIAFNILHNRKDAEECVNDTYLKVWGAIPTLRPLKFPAFIGRITRNLSLNKYEHYNAKKRGQGICKLPLKNCRNVLPVPVVWEMPLRI